MLRDDWTGKVERVNDGLLRLLARRRLLAGADAARRSSSGEAINVDGDRAAAMVAGAFKAEAS